MSVKVLMFLSVGTLAMMIPIIMQAKKYQISYWKGIITAFILTVVGTIGTKIMVFVEIGEPIGFSFYGAVFFVPLVFLLVALVLKIPYGELLDLCAPAECIMLVIMKVQCLVYNCCGGRVLYITDAGVAVRFPSQIAEMLNAGLVFALLMIIFYRGKNKGLIYPYYLLLYGITRFILNFFREEWAAYKGGVIPMGTVWSVVAIVVGLFAIITIKQSRQNAVDTNRGY